ncbi:uncharacterized protein TNCV_4029351 [Trichonephila clavipes]|nr:uncharacterized protein TNCV_4029351 [Trichonephila clavipes]
MRLHLPGNIDEQAKELEKIWQKIPQKTIKILYQSMPRRVVARIQARGKFNSPTYFQSAPKRGRDSLLCRLDKVFKSNGIVKKYIFTLILQTYNTDSQVGDSGACATALLCGVKGRFETVGLDDSARYDKCQSSFNSRIPCLADWAQAEGNI